MAHIPGMEQRIYRHLTVVALAVAGVSLAYGFSERSWYLVAGGMVFLVGGAALHLIRWRILRDRVREEDGDSAE